jgi:hypothetical protein
MIRKADKLSSFVADSIRCAAVGNSFHTGAVALLLSARLSRLMGSHSYISARRLAEEWASELQDMWRHREMSEGRMDFWNSSTMPSEYHQDSAAEAEDELVVKANLHAESGLGPLAGCGFSDGALALGLGDPRKVLTFAMMRRLEYRGSDVRLDSGMLYEAEAWPRIPIKPQKWLWNAVRTFRWARAQHINILELRAFLESLRWRSRAYSFQSSRFIHLLDSQVCIAVIVKGRSSSRQLNMLLRKCTALLLACNSYPLVGYVTSKDNPADRPSRRYAKVKKTQVKC